jgi:hypothetical protein
MSHNVSGKSKVASMIMKLNRRKLVLCLGVFVLGSLFSVFNSTTVGLAWDAGNPKSACVTSECTGGVVTPKLLFLGVLEGWFSMSRAADCPAGYTNNGLTCGRGADSISAPNKVADCPSGYTNTGVSCYRGPDTYGKGCTTVFKKYPCKAGYTDNGCTCGRGASSMSLSHSVCPAGYHKGPTQLCLKDCPQGYSNTGVGTCFRGVSTLPMTSMSCKPGEQGDSGRCIPIPNIKLRGNTHLWVVNRGLDLLAKSSDPVAVTAVKKMGESACKAQWQRGLYDGDEPALADNPTTLNSTAGTHFYNPTHKDAFGNQTGTMTYLVAGVDVSTGGLQGRSNLNARQSADIHIKKLPSSDPTATDPTAKEGCYELGLALHYMTDMTQPMHTSSFSGVSSPQWLHPYFETYVPFVQNRFPANGSWSERWKGESPDDSFYQAAVQSGGLAPALMKSLTASGKQCTIDGIDVAPFPYVGYCFINDPNVDAQIGIVLQDGYQSTASYIYNVFKAHR